MDILRMEKLLSKLERMRIRIKGETLIEENTNSHNWHAITFCFGTLWNSYSLQRFLHRDLLPYVEPANYRWKIY